MLLPGTDVVAAAGGLHSFIKRRMPHITDSGASKSLTSSTGALSASSKAKGPRKQQLRLKITEEGVPCRFYRAGAKILLTP